MKKHTDKSSIECKKTEDLFELSENDYVKAKQASSKIEHRDYILEGSNVDLKKLKESLNDDDLFNEAKVLIDLKKANRKKLERISIISKIKSGEFKDQYHNLLKVFGEIYEVDITKNPELKDIGAELLSTKEEINSKLDLILEKLDKNSSKIFLLEQGVLEKLSDISWKQNVLEEQTVGTWFKVKRFFRNLFI